MPNQIGEIVGAARRDGEKTRAKERVFGFRDEWGQWDPKNQRPEPWDLYNARVYQCEHLRVFPISNWTELAVWQYVAREMLAVPSVYVAHVRPVVRRSSGLAPVTEQTPLRAGEIAEELSVRFRTVGDISCTCPVESSTATCETIVADFPAWLAHHRELAVDLRAVPLSALEGDMVVERGANLAWSAGPTLVELLENAPASRCW
jgi:sulfate adenylyltransferase subunit 2